MGCLRPIADIYSAPDKLPFALCQKLLRALVWNFVKNPPQELRVWSKELFGTKHSARGICLKGCRGIFLPLTLTAWMVKVRSPSKADFSITSALPLN